MTSSSIHLSWTPAPRPPLKYLIVLRPSKGGAPREVRGPPSRRQGRTRAHTWRKKSGRGRGLPNRSPLPPQMAHTWPGTQLHRERGLTQPSPAPAPAPPTLSWLLFQVVVEAPASSAELHNLTSSTEYLVSVLPVYKAGVGEGLQGPVTTGGRGGTWAQGCKGCPRLQPPLGAWHRGSLNPGGAHPQPVTEAESLGLSDPVSSSEHSDVVCVVTPVVAGTQYCCCLHSWGSRPVQPAGPQGLREPPPSSSTEIHPTTLPFTVYKSVVSVCPSIAHPHLSSHPQSSPSPRPLPTPDLFSVSGVCHSWTLHINGTTQHVALSESRVAQGEPGQGLQLSVPPTRAGLPPSVSHQDTPGLRCLRPFVPLVYGAEFCLCCISKAPPRPSPSPPAPLPPPQALTLAAVMPRAIHLTWQPSAGATRYLVQCSPTSPEGKEEGREVRGRGGGEAGEPVWAGGRGRRQGPA